MPVSEISLGEPNSTRCYSAPYLIMREHVIDRPYDQNVGIGSPINRDSNISPVPSKLGQPFLAPLPGAQNAIPEPILQNHAGLLTASHRFRVADREAFFRFCFGWPGKH